MPHLANESRGIAIPIDIARLAAGGATPAARYDGLDWLRGIAALLVVLLHAGIAYTLAPFPGLAWPTRDPLPSPLVDAITWWINGFIMPLFLLMGGCVAARLYERRPLEFVGHRVRRLLGPLAFACVAILPCDLYIWLLGWAGEGRIPLKKLRSLKLGEAGRDLWGVGHLWYLQYLFLFSVLVWGAVQVWDMTHAVRASRGKYNPTPYRLTTFLRTPVGALVWPLLFALPSGVALYWEPRVVIGFRHSWFPLAANMLYYLPCFAGGWWLHAQMRRGTRVHLFSELHAALSLVGFAVLLPMIHRHTTTEFVGPERLGLTSLFAVTAWLAAAGGMGVCLKHLAAPPRAVRFLAEASFWTYLVHHPLVGLAQVALAGSALTAGVKFLIVSTSAAALSLLSYQVLIRHTWLGALLNGRRDPREAATIGRDILPLPAPLTFEPAAQRKSA